MKRSLLLLVLPVAACQPDQPAATGAPAAQAAPPSQQATPATPAVFTPPTGRLRSGDTDQPTDHDTLHVSDGVLYLKPGTAAAFERAPTELAWEVNKRLTSSGLVRRAGDDLLLQPARGPIVKFTTWRTTEYSSNAEINQ